MKRVSTTVLGLVGGHGDGLRRGLAPPEGAPAGPALVSPQAGGAAPAP